MNCIKCGQELREQQVFCIRCLESMEHYPVDPAIPIQLPVHPVQPQPRKKSTRRRWPLSPEEQLPKLRSSIRLLLVALLALLLAFSVTVLLLLQLLDKRDKEPPSPRAAIVSRETF